MRPAMGQSEQPSIALHKLFVTVRQMFSAAPAASEQAFAHRFGGIPSLIRRLPALAEMLLMNSAPLSLSDSIFAYPITFLKPCQLCFSGKAEILCRLCQIFLFIRTIV